MLKLNATDVQMDGQTDGQTERGRCNISRPGPSARREIDLITSTREDSVRQFYGSNV